MTRVLACIPHFFRRTVEDSNIGNGSNFDSVESRSEQFSYCLRHLVAILAETQFLMGSPDRIAMEDVRLTPKAVTGEVIIVSTPENNLLNEVSNQNLVEHVIWDGPPRELGYHCRRTFAKHVGEYDFYCFIEDDTAILDSTFFRKVAAFYETFGDDKVLQPNRFELAGVKDAAWRAYLDIPAFPNHRAPEREGPDTLWLSSYGGKVRFDKTTDAMSGCYVITDAQLRMWMSQPDFHGPDPRAIAAGLDTLELNQIALGGLLPFYRSVGEDLNFLEVHHVPNRLSRLRTPNAKVAAIIQPIVDERRRRRAARNVETA